MADTRHIQTTSESIANTSSHGDDTYVFPVFSFNSSATSVTSPWWSPPFDVELTSGSLVTLGSTAFQGLLCVTSQFTGGASILSPDSVSILGYFSSGLGGTQKAMLQFQTAPYGSPGFTFYPAPTRVITPADKICVFVSYLYVFSYITQPVMRLYGKKL